MHPSAAHEVELFNFHQTDALVGRNGMPHARQVGLKLLRRHQKGADRTPLPQNAVGLPLRLHKLPRRKRMLKVYLVDKLISPGNVGGAPKQLLYHGRQHMLPCVLLHEVIAPVPVELAQNASFP